MIEKRIPLEGATALTLTEMASDVALIGWDEADLLIRLEVHSEENLTVEQTETGPAVSARVACELHLPHALPVVAGELMANLRAEAVSDLKADEVHGNAYLSQASQAVLGEVYGNLKTDDVAAVRVSGTVYGSATLRDGAAIELQNIRGNVSGATLESLNAARISGNLTAKDVNGPLAVERVGGNATLKAVAGAVSIEKVSGNLTAKSLAGGAKVEKIGGNLLLNGEIGQGCTYQFKAGGNALLRFDEETSAHLTLSAKGLIRSAVTLTDSEQQGRTMTGSLGEGGAEIVVEADGNILVGSTNGRQGLGYGSLGEEISRQIEESLRAIDLERVGEQISAEMDRAMSQLRVKLESVDWDRIGQQTQRSVERAIERMQRDIDRMTEKAARRQEKLERMAERAAREKERMERTGQRWAERPQWRTGGMAFGAAGGEDEPRPNLDQERLAILKMVEEGKINSEEAEKLLDALQ